ncbi:hypothetical protein YB2330_006083 [Saitoella coloradoensis]
MGKTAKRRKVASTAAVKAIAPPSPSTSADDTEITSPFAVISQDDLDITIDTLEQLAAHPTLLKHKDLRQLRSAVWAYSQSLPNPGNSLTARLSSALEAGAWTDARVLLAEMKIRGIKPKLGALQRWVRECDAAGVGVEGGWSEEVMTVLDGILRVCQPARGGYDDDDNPLPVGGVAEISSTNTAPKRKAGELHDIEPFEDGEGKPVPVTPEALAIDTGSTSQSVVRRHPAWSVGKPHNHPIYANAMANTLTHNGAMPPDLLKTKFTAISTIPGPERRPANLYPAIIYASQPGTITMSKTHPPVVRHDVPDVPGAFLLQDALSVDECTQIIRAGETMGFLPDVPAQGDASVLAHNFIWFADQAFHDTLWSRIVHLLPERIAGGKVWGLNVRFRVYRYVPGAIYRPHIDGAWPPSGIDPAKPVHDSYLYDASPPDKPLYSRLTFLIYLNDEFPGGHTTFFLPSPTRDGILDAHSVKPRMGSVLVFPHGEGRGSLLHEGSAVGGELGEMEGGGKGVVGEGKYVIRTDVVYEVKRGEVRDKQ